MSISFRTTGVYQRGRLYHPGDTTIFKPWGKRPRVFLSRVDQRGVLPVFDSWMDLGDADIRRWTPYITIPKGEIVEDGGEFYLAIKDSKGIATKYGAFFRHLDESRKPPKRRARS